MMSMLKLKRPHQTPPGGYVYTDKDLDMNFQANTLKQLVEKVEGMRKINEKEVPSNLHEIIEDWICQRLEQSFVIGEQAPGTQQLYMPYSVVKIATEMFLTKWRLSGGKSCSTKIAEERAVICMACSCNTTNATCLSCRGLVSWIRTKTQRKTSHDSILLVCNKCAVMNIAAIHCDDKYIRKSTTPDVIEAVPDTCWKKIICKGA